MSKEKIIIGLDIEKHSLNLVKLAKGASGEIKLLDFASVSLSPELAPAEKARQLENFVRAKGINALAVNVGISGETVVVRYIDLPKMKKNEISQALAYEAQQYIPFKMEEVIFDFHPLNVAPTGNNRMKVLLVAAKKQAILNFIKSIQQAGLRPNLIDVNSFALINCFTVNGPKVKESDIYAVLNLEFDVVNINILQGGLPFFTRDISLEEANAISAAKGEAKAELFAPAMPLLASLIREVKISIDYFESEFEKQVPILYLSGAGAKFPELVQAFSSQLGREVLLWDPLRTFAVDAALGDRQLLKDTSIQLALASGLALRGI
ncbi:MAG: type IV pilus assembly protein PilM [Candidatus Omnitrophota bacterium]